MSALHYGLTPKMKPISPRRSALVAALDVGSSKVACLIARLRPHAAAAGPAPTQPRHRGGRLRPCRRARHQGRRRGQSGAGRGSHSPSGRWRRAHGSGRDRIGRAVDIGRPARQRIVCRRDRHRRHRCLRGRYRARARRRQPAFDARGPRRAAFAADRLFDRRRQRHPRSARHAGQAVRRRHACRDHRRRGGAQSDACGRALPSRRRGHGREPLRRRPVGARRRRGRSRRGGRRHGRRHDDDGGLRRRPLRSFGRIRARRTAMSRWTSRADSTPASPMPSESRRFMAVCSSVDRTNAT